MPVQPHDHLLDGCVTRHEIQPPLSTDPMPEASAKVKDPSGNNMELKIAYAPERQHSLEMEADHHAKEMTIAENRNLISAVIGRINKGLDEIPDDILQSLNSARLAAIGRRRII